MPVYFSVPLPGPFRYSKRVRRPRFSRRGYRRAVPVQAVEYPRWSELPLGLRRVLAVFGWTSGWFVAFVVAISVPFVGLPMLAALTVHAIVRHRRKAVR
jgi:hypothetical protein